jgi:O-antigen ligase
VESRVAKSVVYTGAFTTLAFTFFFFDSLMLPKFISLFIGALFVFNYYCKASKNLTFNPRTVLFLSGALLFSLLLSGIASDLGTYQILFGQWARYNGLLSYLFYMTLFLVGICLQSRVYTNLIAQILVILGYVLVIFGIFELSGFNLTKIISTDPHLKLTLGNSNFSSIIIVMTFSATFSQFIYGKKMSIQKVTLFVSLVFHIFLVFKTSASQGLVVLTFACMFLLGFWFLSNFSPIRIKVGYIVLWSIPALGIYTLLDFILRGPLSQFIGIKSLVDRYFIWQTAISMWRDNLLTGVGIDSFGSWFGQYQKIESLEYKVITENYDNAHNIYLNFLATGGLLVFMAYCLITLFIGFCAFDLIRRKKFNPNIIVLICIWLVFQIQSLVSIDYLSISTWNWIIAGAIVSEFYISKNNSDTKISLSGYSGGSKLFLTTTKISLFAISVLALLLLLPTIKAEYKINNLITDKKYVLNSPELKAVNSEILSLALEIRYPEIKIYSISALQTYGDINGALTIALDSTSNFPRSTRSWATLAYLYEQKGEKELALKAWGKASELDPLNEIYKQRIASNS